MKKLSEIYSKASNRMIGLVEQAKMTENLFMIIMAILIGLLSGFGAVGIRWLIRVISEMSFSGENTFLQNVIAAPWYVKLIVPAIGGLIVGPIIYYLAPEAKGHGVPEVMQAILTKGGTIRPRVAAVKAFASSVTIGTGGSVGREGPIIQIGSSIGSTVGQFFKVPTRRMKTLVGCGAAAGIAAAFNAPIAGALFAVEIVLMDFNVKQFTPIVISSVMATVVSHQFEGNYPAFVVPQYFLASPYEIGFYFILGLFCGVVSYLFIKVLYYLEDFWDSKFNIPEIFKASIGGLIVGAIALLYPQVMGVGYDTITLALNSQMLWSIAFVLIFVKIIATSLTLASGGSGGIFAPSLFMGAMVGAMFGHFMNLYFPDITAQHGAYALVAMGGLIAGTTRGPITAIIIVFEMTKDYNIILPLMIVCTISMILSTKLTRESIYTLKLLLRNINVSDRAESSIMKTITVNDVFTEKFEHISENTNFNDIVQKVINKKTPFISVWKMDNKLMGTISINQIKEYLFEREALKFLLIAGDIADKSTYRIKPGDNCKLALDYMDKNDCDGLPVVSSEDENKQIGMIWRKDIYDAYHREINHIDITSDLASKITLHSGDLEVRFLDGYLISELPAPNKFIGKSIRDLNIRVEYGVDVLSIKKQTKKTDSVKALPDANYVIQKGDLLVVAGETSKIDKIKNMQ